MESVCTRLECNNKFNHPSSTIQHYCSKTCRYLARGSKRGKRLANKILKITQKAEQLN